MPVPDQSPVVVHPLTAERFDDFEQLFGPRGACGGCWFMYWKLRGKMFDENKGENSRKMQRSIVNGGAVPGLLAYINDRPVGWAAVEPRQVYSRLAHSRILSPVDDKDVWSVPCFFVDRSYRKRGVAFFLLIAAIQHVRKAGGRILEGYPVDTLDGKPDLFLFTGTASVFIKAGFTEVARRSHARPIYRFFIQA